MLKYSLLSAIFTTLFVICSGQKKSIEYGFQGGINFNSVRNTPAEKFTGFTAGGHIKLNTTAHFGLIAALQFEQNGYAYRTHIFVDGTETNLAKGEVINKLNYLDLPLLAACTFGKKIKFNIGAGLFVGVLLSNRYIMKIQNTLTDEVTTTKSKSDFQKINYGLSVGAGAQFPLTSKIRLDLGLGDNYGLANLYKSHGSMRGDLKINALSISSGLSFLL